MKREDNFNEKRGHLKDLSTEQLKERFWKLTEEIIDPFLTLGYENTSPAIERSVLLRMGFSSLEVKSIVDKAYELELLGHGAGNIVYRLSKENGTSIRDTGLELAEGKLWDRAVKIFKG